MLHNVFKKVYMIPLGIYSFFIATAVMAQDRTITPIALTNPTGLEDLGQLINRLIEYSLMFVAVVGVLYLILQGFNYIMAGGDQKKAAAARAGIQNVIIGLIVAFIAFLLVKFILINFLGVDTNLVGDWENRADEVGI